MITGIIHQIKEGKEFILLKNEKLRQCFNSIQKNSTQIPFRKKKDTITTMKTVDNINQLTNVHITSNGGNNSAWLGTS